MNRIHKFLDTLANYGGDFLFITSILAFIYGAVYSTIFDVRRDNTSFPLNILVIVGIVLLLASFIGSSRNRLGKWPTLAMLAFSYLFAATIGVTIVKRIEATSYIPNPPDWLLHADRALLYWLIFITGTILAYGSRRGWNRKEVNPRPFGPVFLKSKRSRQRSEDLEQDTNTRIREMQARGQHDQPEERTDRLEGHEHRADIDARLLADTETRSQERRDDREERAEERREEREERAEERRDE